MKYSLRSLLVLALCQFGMFTTTNGQTKSAVAPDLIPFYRSARITAFGDPDTSGWIKVSTDYTIDSDEVCMFIKDDDTIPLCVEDTIFIETIIQSQDDSFYMVSGWRMLHHHDCDEQPTKYSPEAEEFITEGAATDTPKVTKKKNE